MSTFASTLEIRELTVSFDQGRLPIVRGVSFDVPPGGSFGLIGESGSGKSLTCRAVISLLPPGARAGGRITHGGASLLDLPKRRMQQIRGSQVGMVFQDPMTSLNPLLQVGDAIAQVVRAHDRVDRSTARRRAVGMLERVGIANAARRARFYPHQFSGGMRQRVAIAMALAAHPTLLIADEPTSALDVIVQAEILRLLDQLRREEGMSLLLVSHDFGVVVSVCDRVGVMYAGQLVEEGRTNTVLLSPKHPYTVGLIKSLPEASMAARPGRKLVPIPGAPPEAGQITVGCAFAPRCPLSTEECVRQDIPLLEMTTGHYARCIHTDRLHELRGLQPSTVMRSAPPARNGVAQSG